jgi:hypothetical protein
MVAMKISAIISFVIVFIIGICFMNESKKLHVVIPKGYNGTCILGFKNTASTIQSTTIHLNSEGFGVVDCNFNEFNFEKNLSFEILKNTDDSLTCFAKKSVSLDNYNFHLEECGLYFPGYTISSGNVVFMIFYIYTDTSKIGSNDLTEKEILEKIDDFMR